MDRAVAAARLAFQSFQVDLAGRAPRVLRTDSRCYNARGEDIAEAVSREMGAPLAFARDAQVWAGRVHLEATIEALETYEFTRLNGSTLMSREPVGVAALITPWNWPLNQIVCKVARRWPRMRRRPEAERDCADQRADLRRDRRGGRGGGSQTGRVGRVCRGATASEQKKDEGVIDAEYVDVDDKK